MFIDNLNLALFSKSVEDYPIEKLPEKLQSLGIYSVDLTVRPGGIIDPLKVKNDLPKLQEMLLKKGITIAMITTNITDASDEASRRIIKTASKLGIKYYKLGYFKYEGFGTLKELRKKVRKNIAELSDLNGEYKIQGGFHNHSNDFFGASVWDVFHAIKNVPPQTIGAYFDPAHAVIEGGSCAWKMGMDLLSDRIIMLAVKDFHWVEGKHRYAGGRRHSVEVCPLADGNVPWTEVLQILRSINFKGPVSIHSEYKGAHCFSDLGTEDVFSQTEKDVSLFKQWCSTLG